MSLRGQWRRSFLRTDRALRRKSMRTGAFLEEGIMRFQMWGIGITIRAISRMMWGIDIPRKNACRLIHLNGIFGSIFHDAAIGRHCTAAMMTYKKDGISWVTLNSFSTFTYSCQRPQCYDRYHPVYPIPKICWVEQAPIESQHRKLEATLNEVVQDLWYVDQLLAEDR